MHAAHLLLTERRPPQANFTPTMAQINTIPADESEPLLLRSGSKTKRKSLATVSLVLGCLAATAIASSGGFRGASPTGNTHLSATNTHAILPASRRCPV